MSPKNSVSMRDVAMLAQVSVGTVSNVLNSPDRVSDTTRRRVEQAIEKLGWVPNESARQLRAGRSRSIGMVVMDIANPFFTDVARGAEELLYAEQYSVQIGNSDSNAEREQTLLERFEQQRVGGILFAPINDSTERVLRLRQRGIPVVIVDRVGAGGTFCSVAVDDVLGGRIAVEHLAEQGHTRVAVIGGPESIGQVRERLEGAKEIWSELGLPADDLVYLPTAALTVAEGRSAGERLAGLPARRP